MSSRSVTVLTTSGYGGATIGWAPRSFPCLSRQISRQAAERWVCVTARHKSSTSPGGAAAVVLAWAEYIGIEAEPNPREDLWCSRGKRSVISSTWRAHSRRHLAKGAAHVSGVSVSVCTRISARFHLLGTDGSTIESVNLAESSLLLGPLVLVKLPACGEGALLAVTSTTRGSSSRWAQ
jgi:hypothetical protein